MRNSSNNPGLLLDYVPHQLRFHSESPSSPASIILVAQTAGAALASVVSPSKVVVGTSTASMTGHEGEVTRHLLVYISILVLFVSIMSILGGYLV